MKNTMIWAGLTLISATAASAHPGAHIHPHDGAHWLAITASLAALALAGGVVAAKVRSRK